MSDNQCFQRMAGNSSRTPGPFKGHKRTKTGDDSDTDNDNDNGNQFWTRFFVLSDVNGGKIKASPFGIQKTLEIRVGTPASVKRLRSGELLVEVKNSNQSAKIRNLTRIIDSEVKVVEHQTLNSSRRIISSPDLVDCTPEELVDGLKNIGVTNARKLGHFGTYLLTFCVANPPDFVNVGYVRLPCKPYVPNPLRCFNCNKYGHGSNTCKNNGTCSKCGQTGHKSEGCSAAPHCINCDGDHAASDRDCPVWKREKEVNAIKFTRGISYPEARKIVDQPTPSYSSVVASSAPAASSPTVAAVSDASGLVSQLTGLVSALATVVNTLQTVAEALVSRTPAVVTSMPIPDVPENLMEVVETDPVSRGKKSSNLDKTHVKTGHTVAVSAAERVPSSSSSSASVKPLSSRTQVPQAVRTSGVINLRTSHQAHRGTSKKHS